VTHEVDVAEDLGLPGLAPTRLLDGKQVAADDAAGIVNKQVRIRTGFKDRAGRFRRAHVLRLNADDSAGSREFRAGLLELGLFARDQMEPTALARQTFGNGPADAARSACHHRQPASQSEIHRRRSFAMRQAAAPIFGSGS
jgi:hypothetical protein